MNLIILMFLTIGGFLLFGLLKIMGIDSNVIYLALTAYCSSAFGFQMGYLTGEGNL